MSGPYGWFCRWTDGSELPGSTLGGDQLGPERKDHMDTASPKNETSAVKKAYGKPSLVEYGSIAKLTQGGQGSGLDGGQSGRSMGLPAIVMMG